MPSILGNALPLFINVIIWEFQVGSLFTLDPLHNFTHIKVKEVCLTEWTLHLKKVFPSHSKMLL